MTLTPRKTVSPRAPVLHLGWGLARVTLAQAAALAALDGRLTDIFPASGRAPGKPEECMRTPAAHEEEADS